MIIRKLLEKLFESYFLHVNDKFEFEIKYEKISSNNLNIYKSISMNLAIILQYNLQLLKKEMIRVQIMKTIGKQVLILAILPVICRVRTN